MADPSEVPSLRPPRSRAAFLGAVALAAVALGTAITFIAVGQEGEPIEITGVSGTNQLYGGIPQDGAVLGSEGATVTISVFNDLQCPACRQYHERIVPPLVRDLVRPGEARLEMRHYSIGRDEPTTIAAIAAEAAGEQSSQWQFAHLFLLNLDEAGVTAGDDYMRSIAGAAGLDLSEWEDAREAPAATERVQADAELARELELTAAPAAVVDGPGGVRRLTDEPGLDKIEAAVESVR